MRVTMCVCVWHSKEEIFVCCVIMGGEWTGCVGNMNPAMNPLSVRTKSQTVSEHTATLQIFLSLYIYIHFLHQENCKFITCKHRIICHN